MYKKCVQIRSLRRAPYFEAKSQLAQEIFGNEHYKCATAEIYVVLTDEAALRLAQQHNPNTHFTHADIQGPG